MNLLLAGQIFSSSHSNKFDTFLTALTAVKRVSFTLKSKRPKGLKTLLMGLIKGAAIESTILIRLFVKAPTISWVLKTHSCRSTQNIFCCSVIISDKASLAPFIIFVAAQNKPSNIVLTKGISGNSTPII